MTTVEKMLSIGHTYLNANEATKHELMAYYNEHCFKLVKPERRYRIQHHDNWCAMFVSVLAHKAGNMFFPFEVSVYYQTIIAKSLGTLKTPFDYKPKVGDLVVYDWSGRGGFNHVGIIAEIESGVLKVLEGNYRKTVGYRFVHITSKFIRNYIVNNGKGLVVVDDSERINALVAKVMRGELGDGDDRVKALGKDYRAVQDVINRLL